MVCVSRNATSNMTRVDYNFAILNYFATTHGNTLEARRGLFLLNVLCGILIMRAVTPRDGTSVDRTRAYACRMTLPANPFDALLFARECTATWRKQASPCVAKLKTHASLQADLGHRQRTTPPADMPRILAREDEVASRERTDVFARYVYQRNDCPPTVV
jgi:hypothetical protein